LLRDETNLGLLVLFYVIRFYVECLDLNAVRNIDAVQNKDDRFPLLESDGIWLVGKSLGDDFNSPGGLRGPIGTLQARNITARNTMGLDLAISLVSPRAKLNMET
jgi:hypothetical protein